MLSIKKLGLVSMPHNVDNAPSKEMYIQQCI